MQSETRSARTASAGGVMSTSRSLLARLRTDDAAAWDRLVPLYTPLVYHWCRKLSLPEQDMPDVFQEVFKSVASNITNFRKERPSDTFRGWLRTITRNKVNDHFRRRGRQPLATGGTDANLQFAQLPAPALNDDEPDEQQSRQQLFRRALDLIREDFAERTWQAFWKTVVEGRDTRDVAEELSMRPGTVRVAKSRVLQRLRQQLGDVID